MRHPAEMPLLVAVIGAGVVALLCYAWSMTVTAESCGSVFSLIGVMLGIGSIDGVCSGSTLGGAEAFATIITLMIGIGIVIWVVRAMLYARMRATAVRMSPTQFPEGYRMVVEAAQKFGLRRVPDAYVVLGNGQINAFASGHGHRRFIAVYSDMFEIGGSARDPRALRFVISHEVGHLAAGHTSFVRLIFSMIGMNIPLLGTALSRAQEYTADNYGYDMEPSGAPGVIGVLGAGKYLGAHVNFHAVADRAATESGFWLHIANWLSTHPVLTWRAQALRDRSRPGRIMIAPKFSDGAVWATQIMPAGSMSTQVWPTPAQVLAMLDTVKPVYAEEQFGRFPGVDYDVPADEMRLANPAPVTSPILVPPSTYVPGGQVPNYPASPGQVPGYPMPGSAAPQPPAYPYTSGAQGVPQPPYSGIPAVPGAEPPVYPAAPKIRGDETGHDPVHDEEPEPRQ